MMGDPSISNSQSITSGQSLPPISLVCDDVDVGRFHVLRQPSQFYPGNHPPPYTTVHYSRHVSPYLPHTRPLLNPPQQPNAYPIQSARIYPELGPRWTEYQVSQSIQYESIRAPGMYPSPVLSQTPRAPPEDLPHLIQDYQSSPGCFKQVRSNYVSLIADSGCILDGEDCIDSEKNNFLRSRHDKHPINVKFTNKTNEKIILYWIDEKGKFEKLTKIKSGLSRDIDTFVSHVFLAETKKGHQLILNGNISYFVEQLTEDQKCVLVDIVYGPKGETLQSSISGETIKLKFSNRTHKHVSLIWHDSEGHEKCVKNIVPKTAWLCNAHNGQYFTVIENNTTQDSLVLNYGWFYLAKLGKVGCVRKILITEPVKNESSSSSSD